MASPLRRQPVNGVSGHDRSLFWESYETHKHTHTMDKVRSVLKVKADGTYSYHCALRGLSA
jgi:hypothetical protein